jgi:O-antigen ligase
VVLVAMDGIPSRIRLDVLLRRLVVAGAAIALLGLAQFETGRSFTDLVQIPGLSQNSDLQVVIGRGGFNRPAGTALHPIEFGIVLTMILPIAIHYALADVHRSRLRRWLPVLAIGIDVPISISRSAIVCTLVVLVFLLPTWPRRLRRRTYAAITGLMAVMFVAVPGILGTLAGLFSGISSDSSAQSRTGAYSTAWEFISRSPVVGRGFQTFLPAYHILDNQYLLSAIEIGFAGLLVLLAFFVTGVVCARGVRRASTDTGTRQLAQALAASMAAGGASFALFDALSFPQTACMVFLVAGTIGALRRLEHDGESTVVVRRRPARRTATSVPG